MMNLADRRTSRDAPLRGRRIIITRAADHSSPLAERLRTLGAEVVEIPLTRTVDADDGGATLTAAVARLSTYDWVVVTSPEGARRLRAALATADRRLSSPGPRFAAVGGATAAALGDADLIPAVQTGKGLGEAFPVGQGRVLLPVARDARTDVEEALAAKGWSVERITTYGTEPVVFAAPEVSSLRAVVDTADAVIFAASSAVRAWSTVLGAVMPRVVVAMGPTTAETLDALGCHRYHLATQASLDGVIDAVVAALTS